jgi:hypothetical protein
MTDIDMNWQFMQRDLDVATGIIMDGYNKVFNMLDQRDKNIKDLSYLEEEASIEFYVIYFPWVKPLIQKFVELYPTDRNWYCYMMFSIAKTIPSLYEDESENTNEETVEEDIAPIMETIGQVIIYFINELKLNDTFDLNLLEELAPVE